MGKRSGIAAVLFLAGLMASAAQSGVAAPKDHSKMNVLFVIVDDLRSEIGSWGYDYMVTPNLDRLATTGMRFTRT